MSWEAWLTLAVVVATVVALARDLLPAVTTVLGATMLLFVTGVIDSAQAFAGFSNPAPITVAALYVLARAVEITGALDPVTGKLLGGQRAQHSERFRIASLIVPSGAASAVLNNTPIVAMAAPQVAAWANRRGFSTSRLLMPLSFAAILGGLVTAIGTSTNLVVSGLLQEAGQAPMGLFEITRVGLPVALIGLLLVVLVTPWLLPVREAALDTFDRTVREFSMTMRVVPGGPVDGQTIEEAGLRDLQGVYLASIERTGERVALASPTTTLHGDDLLMFVGKVDLVVDLQRKRGLESTEQRHAEGVDDHRAKFYEAVIGEDSPLLGRTLKEFGFRGRYDGAVLAIHRAGQRVDAKLGEVSLRVGDTLLILADDRFVKRWRDSRDFLLISPVDGNPPARTRKAPLVGLITLVLVLLAGTGVLPILEASIVAAFLLLVTRVLTTREARDSVDLNVIIIIAAAFGLGAAVSTTGLADELAALLVTAFDGWGAHGALLGVILATVVLTELITNNAAAVLMFPIAMSTAASLGASPRPFAFAVAIAASASFLTPIGYQTNTMVYGLGGYRFGDFARLGFPLTITVIAVSLVLIPIAWPF